MKRNSTIKNKIEVNARSYILVFVLLFAITASAQNLEQIGIKKGIKVNGSLNLSSVGYFAKGIEDRRDPFNWFGTGNLNVNLFGYDAPLSFSYSNTNKSYSQPFNQFSFSPSYKWIKTHIGYSSMTFSNYTLAGHMFLGGGVELTPGKWRIAAMYGRLKKATPFEVADSTHIYNAAFKRMGYGLKVGYENNGDAISANIFAAKDEVNSIPFILPESNLTPMQNVAISISGRKKFLKRLFVEAEYAVSALNKDTRANTNESDSIAFKPTHNIISGLLPENSTNRYYDALNASIGYQGNWYSIQLKFEQIAPEYQTLGAYYFNNDMRNITIMPSVRLFKNTLTMAGNVGLQQNNLDDAKESTTKRTVGAVNLNYMPNEKWNFTGSYSNFTSFTNIKPQTDPFFRNTLDTLNFYQVSQTMTGTVLRNLGSQEKPQAIMLNLSYQTASDRATYEGGQNQSSNFISMNVSYSYSIVPSNTSIALAGNIYKNSVGNINTTYWGPTLSLTKAFFEKTLRASLTSSYNETSGNIETSPVLNNRMTLSFSPKSPEAGGVSRHNLALGINALNRLKSVQQQPKYSEVTATFNYTYSF